MPPRHRARRLSAASRRDTQRRRAAGRSALWATAPPRSRAVGQPASWDLAPPHGRAAGSLGHGVQKPPLDLPPRSRNVPRRGDLPPRVRKVYVVGPDAAAQSRSRKTNVVGPGGAAWPGSPKVCVVGAGAAAWSQVWVVVLRKPPLDLLSTILGLLVVGCSVRFGRGWGDNFWQGRCDT